MKRKRILALSRFYHPKEMDGIVAYARQAGWSITFTITSQEELPADWKGDGILLIHSYRSAAIREFLQQQHCPKILIGRHKGQEFCSRSCAQKEVKSAYWGPKDSEVLEALAAPLSRRELSAATGIPIGGLRSILNRLRRRGLIRREGAPRGLYCKWRKAA